MILTRVVGLQPEDRTQKRKIKSEQIHRKIKNKWTVREIAKGADQMTSNKRS